MTPQACLLDLESQVRPDLARMRHGAMAALEAALAPVERPIATPHPQAGVEREERTGATWGSLPRAQKGERAGAWVLVVGGAWLAATLLVMAPSQGGIALLEKALHIGLVGMGAAVGGWALRRALACSFPGELLGFAACGLLAATAFNAWELGSPGWVAMGLGLVVGVRVGREE